MAEQHFGESPQSKESPNRPRHRILILGKKVYGSRKPDIAIDYCDIDVVAFPEEYESLNRLSDYDIAVIDYSAFTEVDEHGRYNTHKKKQEQFDKEMLGALENGAFLCILHYDERVPGQDDYGFRTGLMNKEDMARCRDLQIGFRWLERLQIRPYRHHIPIINSKNRRNEFKDYQDRWGASYNYFGPYGDCDMGDILMSLDEYSLGFCVLFGRGKILYLPCQRDYDRPRKNEKCIISLLNSLVTYKMRSLSEERPWVKEPIFPEETRIIKNVDDLKARYELLQEELAPYLAAKSLTAKSEYEFEDEVPKYLEEHFGFSTKRHEEYKEDFWILNEASEEIVIAECKSYSRGLTKQGIYPITIHRASRGLEESFPALLIVNAHMNASSWSEKNRPIDKDQYKIASENNISVLRVEDVIHFWRAVSELGKEPGELLETIINESGWIEIGIDGEIVIHK